jgi:hypothetical protein
MQEGREELLRANKVRASGSGMGCKSARRLRGCGNGRSALPQVVGRFDLEQLGLGWRLFSEFACGCVLGAQPYRCLRPGVGQ